MSIQGPGGFDLDSLLERELQGHAAAQPPSPLPDQAAYHAAFVGGTSVSALSTITAALTTKAAAGAAAALLVGGAVAGTVSTGSPNPTVWGQTVVAAVQGCKTAEAAHESKETSVATSARMNVGRCVSAVASQHGEAERDKHAKNPSPDPTDSKNKPGRPSDHPTGKPTEKPDVHPSNQPTAKPSEHPTGKPSDTPGGRPSDTPPVTPPGHKP